MTVYITYVRLSGFGGELGDADFRAAGCRLGLVFVLGLFRLLLSAEGGCLVVVSALVVRRVWGRARRRRSGLRWVVLLVWAAWWLFE